MAKVNFLYGTAANYNALSSKDTNTLYLLTDTKKIYKGDTLIVGSVSGTISADDIISTENSTKTMTGTYSIIDGYCFIGVKAELRNGQTNTEFPLPVNVGATGTAIVAGANDKYFCTTTSNNTIQISKLVSGTCEDETINFTLIYKVRGE